jgi:hypothetical protein
MHAWGIIFSSICSALWAFFCGEGSRRREEEEGEGHVLTFVSFYAFIANKFPYMFRDCFEY